MKIENKLSLGELYARLKNFYSKYQIEFSKSGIKDRMENFTRDFLFAVVPLFYMVNNYRIHLHGKYDDSEFDITITKSSIEIHAKDENLESELAKSFISSTRLDDL